MKAEELKELQAPFGPHPATGGNGPGACFAECVVARSLRQAPRFSVSARA
jgi:hypothetical protein